MSLQTKSKKLQVTYYRCGHCVNQLSHVYKGHKKEQRIFPSGVFLIHHPKHGYTLFDTGYSTDIYNQGLISKLYCRLNPTFVNKSDEIASQLRKDGIKPKEIQYVILSHMHPDHIGGVKFFPNAKVIISEYTHNTFQKPRAKDLLLKGLLPSNIEQQFMVIKDADVKVRSDGLRGFDLFGDKSLLVVGLPGHTKGHLGAYIPGKLLLAGDASWGQDLLEHSHNLRFVAKQVQHDYSHYKQTVVALQKLRTKGVAVCFSHDTYRKRQLL